MAPSPMASSPEIGPPPENKPMDSPPPFPSAQPPQENPQPTAADPLEPAQSDHAKSTPPPHPGNATATSPEAYESPAPAPKGGTIRQGPPPSPSSSPALEGTEPEEPTSPLPPPPPVETCPEAATAEASPSPSPQISAASAPDTPPPSTPSSPPGSPPGSLPDVPPADSAATVPKDAAWLPAALESMDANRPTAPTPPKPPLKGGPEGLAQQHPRGPPCPTMLPGYGNSEPAQPPSPRRPRADIAHALPDVAETDAIGVTSEEPGASSACKGDAVPMTVPFSSPTEAEPCSPEMAPPGFEKFLSSWQLLCTPLSATADIMPDAAATELLAVTLEEAAGPRPALEATDVDMQATNPLLVPLESGMEETLQEPQPRRPSPTVQDMSCSPDMVPPGFENFKSPQLLLPSPPLAQLAYTFNDPATTEAEQSEEAAQPSPAPEAMDVNMEISLENGADGSFPQQLHQLPSPKEKSTASLLETVPSGHENLQLLPLPSLLPQVHTPDVLADVAATKSVMGALDQVHHPAPVPGTIKEGTSPILSPPLGSSFEGSLPQLEPQMNSVTTHAVDIQPDAPATNYMDFKSDETALPLPALQAMDTNMDSATTALLLWGNRAEGSSPQLQHQPSSPSMQAAPCSLDDLEPLPPPPLPFLNKEMGQMVCGSCRELIAYPRGADYVQCAGCRTINLVLEAHEVGNVRCGRCDTLLMYPFGAPAVKCSWCLFVTEIGERNVRPRISVEQVVSPPSPELVNQG